MPTILSRLWQNIVEANANFYDFVLWLNEFAVRFFESEYAKGLFGEGASFSSVVEKYRLLPLLLLLFGLVEAAYGRRFLKAQKLVLAFIVGFAVGAVYIAPIVSAVIPIDHFIIGLALGIVLAFFRSPLYWFALASVTLYSIYYQLVNRLNFASFFALVVSAIIVVLIFVFLLKWLEYLGTAFFGGWIFAIAFAILFRFPAGTGSAAVKVIAFIVAAHGFAAQYLLDRRRKKAKNAEAAS